jgi:hypothetical protein
VWDVSSTGKPMRGMWNVSRDYKMQNAKRSRD